MRLNADLTMVSLKRGGSQMRMKLTWDKHIFIWGTDELHGLLGEDRHVLVRGIARDIFIGTVVERDEDIQ